jgi:hypothetical protein
MAAVHDEWGRRSVTIVIVNGKMSADTGTKLSAQKTEAPSRPFQEI